MGNLLIDWLERAFSRYLALDPHTLKRLATLSGQVVKIHLTDWNKVLYLLPNANGIQIKTHHLEKVSAEIKGSSLVLLRLGFTDPHTATTLTKQLDIKGDLHLAQTFSQILQQISIDWEEPLSHYTGDTLAHQLGSLARGFKRWGLKTKYNLQTNISEYLQEEARYLPPAAEVEDFFSEVSALQHDVARLEAKFKHLTKDQTDDAL